jgi:hypothetical protein
MAKIDFSSDNTIKQFNDYPKLKFEAKGEKARVVVLDDQPEVEWVHTLRAPVVINGQLQMETVKGQDGSTSEKPKMDFIGQHLCLGNVNTLAENGRKGSPGDPDNCPTCAAGKASDAVEPPRRRMAIHVVRYKTQPGSFKPQEPFQAELLAWVFGEKAYTALVSISEEHGDLRRRDLLLECTNKGFQNVEIQVGGSAAWLENETNKKFVQSLYVANKCEDFTPLLARKLTRDQIEEDLSKVRIRHAQAYGGSNESAGTAPSTSETSAALGLDDLLSGPTETVTGTSTDTTEPVPEAAPVTVDSPAAPEPEPSSPTAAAGDDVLDFDALLQGL